MTCEENYKWVMEKVEKALDRSGRKAEELTLVAVSKTHPWEEVTPLYELGCRNFGENRVPEFLEKKEQAPGDIHWHFIGSLQKKKVNKVVGQAALIHSIDHLELAQKVDQRSEQLGLTTKVLIQVNTSGEISKHGLSSERCDELWEEFQALSHLDIQGLMTMAPFSSNEKEVRTCFSALRELKEQLGGELPHLSMGMSNDFPWAIEEGATLVRLGSCLFHSPS